MHVVLAGGGTAGHVEPALATADALRRHDPGIGITLLGTQRGLETRLVPARGYDLALIPAVAVPRRPTLALLTLPGRLRGAVGDTAALLDRVGADVLVGFGGYVAAPAYLAARRRGIPIVVHEANVRPGLANRLGARFAVRTATAWPGTGLRGSTVVGMPLRRAISTLDRSAQQVAARTELGLATGRTTLLVFGGSQGARTLNTAALGAAGALAAAGIQVLHVAGKAAAELEPPSAAARSASSASSPSSPSSAASAASVFSQTDAPAYEVLGYLDRMELAYAAADLALCRCGAMTCAELAAVGLPAAYVPLPHGNGEQRLNAEPMVAAGGGLLVEDDACSPAWVTETLLPLLADPVRLAAMGAAAGAFGIRDGDDRLAAVVLAAATGQEDR